MAKEAIGLVKDAEARAKALIQDAIQASRKSKQEAEISAEQEYNNIISQAKEEAERIKNKAIKEGESIAEPILKKGIDEGKALNNLTSKDLDSAVNIIIERIVNANGNS
ncbi:hypothetical protein [Lutispora thermophila]|uniref:V/A-type H+-transporting ATPase subunit G/H n=1 Tax=Lutispora thermophila DSM 19022 TaxID=1122184 RepID=A0A1M6CLQ7_9FIRM|nr:hypothetical protein [Lutispora thermophila]SHI61920.1 V/A-type H+-transporting ATPase subunit G/H [Lutispora thermophila DSM 19022]